MDAVPGAVEGGDMTRNEAADILCQISIFGRRNGKARIAEAVNMAIEVLKADAVPVVRCRDCASYWSDREEAFNPKLHYCEQHDVFTRKDDFCSYGERREGENNGR